MVDDDVDHGSAAKNVEVRRVVSDPLVRHRRVALPLQRRRLRHPRLLRQGPQRERLRELCVARRLQCRSAERADGHADTDNYRDGLGNPNAARDPNANRNLDVLVQSTRLRRGVRERLARTSRSVLVRA